MNRKQKSFEVHASSIDFKVLLVSSQKETRNVIGNWKKGDPYNKMTKNLLEKCYNILWKVDIMGNEIGYLAEKISDKMLKECFCFS